MHFYSKENIRKLEDYLGVKSRPSEHEILLWEKVSKYNKYFTKIPGILGIAVCNSLAMNAGNKNSDIDLFIITKKKRLWTVRILMTIFLLIVGERKTRNNHAGKFCLSFFITEDGLDVTDIALNDDIYLAYWIDTLKPIINRENIFGNFWKVNTSLVPPHSILSGEERGDASNILPVKRNILKIDILGDISEKILQFIFLPRTKKSFQKLGKPFGVVISHTMLKFHDKDRRKEIRDKIISSSPQLFK